MSETGRLQGPPSFLLMMVHEPRPSHIATWHSGTSGREHGTAGESERKQIKQIILGSIIQQYGYAISECSRKGIVLLFRGTASQRPEALQMATLHWPKKSEHVEPTWEGFATATHAPDPSEELMNRRREREREREKEGGRGIGRAYRTRSFGTRPERSLCRACPRA